MNMNCLQRCQVLLLLFMSVSSNEETWRPIFKVNGNVTDFGNESNVYDYFVSGESSYSSYASDIDYVVNSFDESSVDSINYRSLIIDNWSNLYSSGQLDKIKISLFKNGSEQAYFIFDGTSDVDSWFSQSNLIESSYDDLKNNSNIEYFLLQDNSDNERRRRQMLSQNINDLSKLVINNNFNQRRLLQTSIGSNYGFIAYYSSTSLNWADSSSYCTGLGYTLAAFHTSTANGNAYSLIYDYVGSHAHAWIGANDISTDGSWEWSDGSDFDYSNWYTGEPNGGTNENCAHFNTDSGTWNDISCTSTMSYFVCSTATQLGTDSNGDYYGVKALSLINWQTAEYYCNDLYGTSLASIHSSTENTNAYNTIYNNVGNQYAWIGLNDITTDGSWEWIDGSNFDYSAWNSGEPNGGTNENCGEYWSVVNWNDASCTSVTRNYFICNSDIPTSAPTEKPTDKPTSNPTNDPTDKPTSNPTNEPTNNPTNVPTVEPTTDISVIGSSYGFEGYYSIAGVNWTEANDYCTSLGYNLAAIHSDAGDNTAYSLVYGHVGSAVNVWIGGSDASSEGNWTWSDGSDFDYNNWYPGEPNNYESNEHCGLLYSPTNGSWNDAPCSFVVNYFVCSTAVQIGSDRDSGYYGIKSASAVNWQTAEYYCNDLYGLNLASIHSDADNINAYDIVVDYVGSFVNIWIGLNDVSSEGNWEWTDGTSYDYSAWNSGEPNGGSNENCVHFVGTYIWNDWYCTNQLNYFVCNSDLTNNPTNSPSSEPTDKPTSNPTNNPTDNPTINPTDNPTSNPTNVPTVEPTPDISLIGSSYGFEGYYSIAGVNWTEANDYCTSLGYNLAAIHSATGDDTAYATIYDVVGTFVNIWIGLSDTSSEGNWTWTDGSDFDYSNWYSGEPNGGTSENCGHYRADAAQWNDLPCSTTMNYFICSTAIQIGSNRDSGYYGVESASGVNWQTAEYYCNDLYGLSLASIHSDADNINAYNAVVDYVGTFTNMWIGLTDVSSEGNWTWADGTDYDYSAWNTGEPNGGSNENCVHFVEGYTWNDGYCTNSVKHFVCNSDLTNNPTSSPSKEPSSQPTNEPSNEPTDKPTNVPTNVPSNNPSNEPTNNPTDIPTVEPTPDTSLIGSSYGFEGYYSIGGVNWTEANDYCASLGYNLAAIHSAAGDDTAYSTIYDVVGTYVNIWIGLSDISSEGNWTWTDGSDFDYSNWYSGEPNGGTTENCAHYKDDAAQWNDLACSTKMNYFICSTAVQLGSSVNGDYYGVQAASAIDWQTAEYYCNDLYGSNLASIHSTTENIYAYDTIYDYVGLTYDRIWIGFNDISSEGNYLWTDGSEFNFTSWYTDEPNGGTSENCGDYIDSDLYFWNDEACTAQFYYFICNNHVYIINTSLPTNYPTDKPTNQPSNVPSSNPTNRPSMNPSNMPSSEPTIGGNRYFQIIENYDGCEQDSGWFVITQGSVCQDSWMPGEGDTIPQIRYSINDGKSGLFSDDSENDVADTMVIYLSVNDIETFGITETPSNVPSVMPSSIFLVNSTSVASSSLSPDDGETESSSSSGDGGIWSSNWITIVIIASVVVVIVVAGVMYYFYQKDASKTANTLVSSIMQQNGNNNNNNNNNDGDNATGDNNNNNNNNVNTVGSTSPLSQNTNGAISLEMAHKE